MLFALCNHNNLNCRKDHLDLFGYQHSLQAMKLEIQEQHIRLKTDHLIQSALRMGRHSDHSDFSRLLQHGSQFIEIFLIHIQQKRSNHSSPASPRKLLWQLFLKKELSPRSLQTSGDSHDGFILLWPGA
ncbi:hypothetical protein D3C73_961600 [compost metagenome]